MSVLHWLGGALMVGGALFFLAGTIGLLRFPDVHSRLHALTKADNVGLGLLIAGLSLWTDSAAIIPKLVLIWVLALVASAASCYLIAHYARPRRPVGGR